MLGRVLYHGFLFLYQNPVCLNLKKKKKTIGTLVFVPSWDCIGTVCYGSTRIVKLICKYQQFLIVEFHFMFYVLVGDLRRIHLVGFLQNEKEY